MSQTGSDSRAGANDRVIVEHIHKLVTEYHNLEKQHRGLGLSPEQRQQLAELQFEVDQHWDQLRRVRAAKRLGEAASFAPWPLMRPGTAR